LALRFSSIVGILTKVVGIFLPGKSKEVIDATVNEIITTDKEIQERIQQERNFILEYEGRAEFLAKAVGIIRAIPRPFIAIAITILLFKYLWLNLVVPDKLWYLSGLVYGFYFYFRHKEKMNGVQ